MKSQVYSLWLPLNKDFFGFQNYWEAPLNIFSEINKEYAIEHPVLIRSQEVIQKISFNDYSFEYIYKDMSKKKRSKDDNTVRSIKFKITSANIGIGTFTIFSHGLYLWEFDKTISEKDFLEHLEILFHTKYLSNRETNKNNQDFFKGYNGILNYFQLELLLDVLYNIYIAPSVFFKIYKVSSDTYKKIDKKFTLYNILSAIILVEHALTKNKNILQPLSKRDTYKIKGNKTNDNTISYLSASIEHFIRVANTFSLEHYRRGLHYCLKNLTEIGIIRTDLFEDGINYNFPSIMEHKSSMMRLESYHGMMYEKLPNLKYLNSLFIGLQKIYLPKENTSLTQAIEQNSRRIETISNFFYSIEKLIEEENTKNIHYEIAEMRKNNEISNQLAVENSEVQKEEMLEILKRKDEQYTKKMFEAIQNNSNKIETMLKQTLDDNSASLNKGVYLLTIVTVEIAILTPIITEDNINTFSEMLSHLSNLDLYSKILLILPIIMALIYVFLPKKHKKALFEKTIEPKNDKNVNTIKEPSRNHEKSLYVFDNSYIDIDHNIDGIYTKLIIYFHSIDSKISIHKMPSLLKEEQIVNCTKYNTIRERYRSYKLYKFTFVSDYDENEENKKIKYTIDIDIQYDTIGDNDTKINNIRIAIIDEDRLNEDELIDIYDNMKKIKKELSDDLLKELTKR